MIRNMLHMVLMMRPEPAGNMDSHRFGFKYIVLMCNDPQITVNFQTCFIVVIQ